MALETGEVANETSGEVTHVLEVLSTMKTDLCVDYPGSGYYPCNELGPVFDCHIALLGIGKEAERLEKPII